MVTAFSTNTKRVSRARILPARKAPYWHWRLPLEEGGSPAGALLGTVSDALGTTVTLFSTGLRAGVRDFNCSMDLSGGADPGGTLPDRTRSSAVRVFYASVEDFTEAQIAPAEIVIAYTDGDIAGLIEAGLEPWRYADGAYTQDGIDAITRDANANTITFTTNYPGPLSWLPRAIPWRPYPSTHRPTRNSANPSMSSSAPCATPTATWSSTATN